MSERKTININPELFKVSGGNNTTRKQRQRLENPNKIQIKEKKPKKISTIKRNILKMIRNQQQENNKKPMERNNKSIETELNDIKTKTDFNETLEYLSTLTKDTDDKKKNQTIKRYSEHLTEINPRVENVEIPIDKNINDQPMIQLNTTSNAVLLPPPKYGCLKNGSLPTYRNWMNQTRKALPTTTLEQKNYEKKLEERIKDWSKIQQQTKIQNVINKEKNIPKAHYKMPKQKRILRRTFYVGRSRVFPKVSVLVANKTIRANTQLKTQHLKQIPISDVKNYLLKNGFIKIGTNAPNDVLREMYENTQMICGEIKNHNPDNLLYNYFNDDSNIV